MRSDTSSDLTISLEWQNTIYGCSGPAKTTVNRHVTLLVLHLEKSGKSGIKKNILILRNILNVSTCFNRSDQ